MLTTQDMLDDLHDGMDNTSHRLKRETKHVEYITEKTKTGGLYSTSFFVDVATAEPQS